MLDNQLDREQLREKVEAEIRRNKMITRWTMFGLNIFMFILFMLISWGIALGTPSLASMMTEPKSPFTTILILPTIGWGMGIVFHLLSMLVDTGAMDKSIRRRVMANVIGEQVFESLTNQGASDKEKAKRDGQRMRLGDDGELVPEDESISDESAPRKKMAGKF